MAEGVGPDVAAGAVAVDAGRPPPPAGIATMSAGEEPPPPGPQRRVAAIALVGVAAVMVVSVVLVLAGTAPRGPGLTIDSATYLHAAEGYRGARSEVAARLNHVFPPGLPAAIAAAGVVADTPLQAARALNALALAVAVGLVGYGTWVAATRAGARPRWAGAATAIGCATATGVSAAMLRWAGAVMSEPLAIVAALASVVAAERGLRRANPLWLIAAGAAAGAAVLVRHVALGTLLGLAGAVLLVAGGSLGRRLVASATVAGAGLVTWLAGTPLLLGGTSSRRRVAWHPPGTDDLLEGLDDVGTYWLPSSLGVAPTRALTVVAALGLVIAAVRAAPAVLADRSHRTTMSALAGLLLVAHLATVVGAMALLDDLTPADDRILLPVVPLLVLALGAWPGWWGGHRDPQAGPSPQDRPARWRDPRLVGAVVLLVILAGQAGQSAEWVRTSRADGVGYAHRLFDRSEVLGEVRRLPATTEVWTNDVALLYLRADRPALQLPSRVDGYAGQVRTEYADELAELAAAVEAGAVIVLADYFPFPNQPDATELEQLLDGLEAITYSDGTILTSTDR